MNSTYIQLSKELEERIRQDRAMKVENPYAFPDEGAVRRYENHDRATLIRPAFVRDCEKIMHVPFYNRYGDKTQVFSLYKNDDITRRLSHVQLVSRTARSIGRALGLNLDLIEAISIGHDIGHTPFGHCGEYKLSEIYHGRTGRYFNHNIHSARVLDTIFPVNLTLQTLDGIICHNGEMTQQEYRPKPYDSFAALDQKMEDCYLNQGSIKKLVPCTLEACVMRVSDIIAYLGKDRHDAVKLGLIDNLDSFDAGSIGAINAQIINNMTVNIIERSYGKPYLQMDPDIYEAFTYSKKENFDVIYKHDSNQRVFDEIIYPMFEQVYERLYQDLVQGKKDSVIFTHHIAYVEEYSNHYREKYLKDCQESSNESEQSSKGALKQTYREEKPDDIVTDFIAAMTDDYFIDLYEYLFPKSSLKVTYKGYFED